MDLYTNLCDLRPKCAESAGTDAPRWICQRVAVFPAPAARRREPRCLDWMLSPGNGFNISFDLCLRLGPGSAPAPASSGRRPTSAPILPDAVKCLARFRGSPPWAHDVG